MILNTRRLFLSLLGGLRIDVICDIGSMNGADAVAFSKRRPAAQVYAFEANPHNFALMQADAALRERRIQIEPLAVSRADGEAEFHLVPTDYGQVSDTRGMSSLFARAGQLASSDVVRVKTTRLDSYLRGRLPAAGRVALWVDAEGAAFEVLEGIGGVAAQVQLLHVETEATACISPRQRLYPQVKSLLGGMGFVELASDRVAHRPQFNAVFVRASLPATARLRVGGALVRAGARQLAAQSLHRLCPQCWRRLSASRAHRA